MWLLKRREGGKKVEEVESGGKEQGSLSQEEIEMHKPVERNSS